MRSRLGAAHGTRRLQPQPGQENETRASLALCNGPTFAGSSTSSGSKRRHAIACTARLAGARSYREAERDGEPHAPSRSRRKTGTRLNASSRAAGLVPTWATPPGARARPERVWTSRSGHRSHGKRQRSCGTRWARHARLPPPRIRGKGLPESSRRPRLAGSSKEWWFASRLPKLRSLLSSDAHWCWSVGSSTRGRTPLRRGSRRGEHRWTNRRAGRDGMQDGATAVGPTHHRHAVGLDVALSLQPQQCSVCVARAFS